MSQRVQPVVIYRSGTHYSAHASANSHCSVLQEHTSTPSLASEQ